MKTIENLLRDVNNLLRRYDDIINIDKASELNINYEHIEKIIDQIEAGGFDVSMFRARIMKQKALIEQRYKKVS